MYDLIVIGSGSGGLTSAFTALGFGKKVLIVEKDKSGGECTWSGCVPSKALINIANEIHTAKKYSDFFIDSFKILNTVRNISEKIYKEESPKVLRKHGAEFLKGFAKFKTKNSIEVNGKIYTAKKFIIATGSSPFIPSLEGLNDIDFLDNESFFQEKKLPKSIIVLGGGTIGVELSQAMNRLGVKVQLVEMMDELLIREDKEIVGILRKKLKEEGLQILTNTKAIKVEHSSNKIYLTVLRDGIEDVLEADKILVALGRKSNTQGMNLEEIGIKIGRGIEVNKHLETSVKGIYACGDVVGPYLLSHMANYQGKIAVMNAILPIKRSVNYKNVAWTSFTQPELARAGLSEEEARKSHKKVRVYNYSFDKLDRAKTKKDDIGFIKVITDKRGKILGATVLADRAGEIIGEIQAIKSFDISMAKLQGVIHPYPTYSDSLRQIAQSIYIDNILENPFVKIAKRLFKK